ncbi:uncharacterized protein BDV17DRAFT_260176 [Aspergillus undulatus]|uniref:uncharacterized protein n=1 Tax=Aspergillus undulatus TaxID=1810928 RepID=UPI003CCD47F8
MNNEQFRRLLINNNKPSSSKSDTGASQSPPAGHNARSPQGGSGSGSGGPGGQSLGLGSRMRSSIPMTPRTLHAPNFAAQLSEYRRERDGNPPPNKKFKASAAPKGTKLPTGYEDRAAARLREDGDSSKSESAAKLKELEEKFKKALIDENTFTRLRRELGVGGDLGSTHMVKGLDWDLLRRVKAGKDVERKEESEEKDDGSAGVDEKEGQGEGEEVDVDEEFDKVLEGNADQTLPSAPREKEKKKGSMAPPPAPAPRKTRDEILKELKASRAAASAGPSTTTAQPEPALGARFKKIGDSGVEKKRFIEQDENGRRKEVLLITDADGKTKRKARWLDKPGTTAPTTAAAAQSAPEKAEKKAKPLGMEVPVEIAAKIKAAQNVEEDEDDNIFAGVGADYDPLGEAGSDEDSSDSEEGEVATTAKSQQEPTDKKETADEPRPAKPRNYFATSASTGQEDQVENNHDRDRGNPLTRDPTLLAALKRAAALRQAGSTDDGVEGLDEEGVDQETLLRRKKFLEEARRREALDAADMDYGFGGSRIEDDEDEEAALLEPRGGNKRKRGPKKKKGDKDSASDVLGVLEGRKKSD